MYMSDVMLAGGMVDGKSAGPKRGASLKPSPR
jgi:hypothetical protein